MWQTPQRITDIHMTNKKLEVARNNVSYWKSRLDRYVGSRRSVYRHASVLQAALDSARAYLAKVEAQD